MGTRRIPRNYPSKALAMPRLLEWHMESRMYLDYLCVEEMKDAYDLLAEAAANDYNVAINEYGDFEEFKLLFPDAEMFTIKDSKTRDLYAVLIIHQSWFSRSFSSCLATLVIIPSRYIMERNAYKKLVQLGVQLMCELELRYEVCAMNMFVCCLEMFFVLKEEGFKPQLVVPLAGDTSKHGTQQSYIMVRRLDVKPQEHRSLGEICDMLGRYTQGTEEAREKVFNALPKISFLPLEYTLDSGLEVCIRSPNDKEELLALCNLASSTAKEGMGYGIDEIPSVDFFLEFMCQGSHMVMFTDRAQGNALVGFVMLARQFCMRTRSRRFVDTWLIVHPNYQRSTGKASNVGTGIQRVTMQIAKELGYIGLLSDALVTNIPILRITPKIGAVDIGIFPQIAYLRKYGWMDTILSYVSFSTIPSLFREKQLTTKSQL